MMMMKDNGVEAENQDKNKKGRCSYHGRSRKEGLIRVNNKAGHGA